MDYQQTIDYLFAQLPMFFRVGPAAYKANLDNTIALANRIHNPQNSFKSIHIAGTNGKGSVAHMLASVFQQAGYKTGLCTSPHLKDFRERFRINGKMMPKEFVTSFVNQHKSYFESLQPSFFEMTIAMCFDYFAKEMVDIAIIETGLGGRLDSTNIITPELSVITNIGFDHTNLLGNTIEAIAREKAGIIKPGIPVVVGKCREDALQVFREKAKQSEAEIFFADEEYKSSSPVLINQDGQTFLRLSLAGNNKVINIESPLTGTYQYENLCTTMTALDVINQYGRFKITKDAVKDGIRNTVKNTGIAGRWQIIGNNPLVICDTGHNADGLKSVVDNINLTPHKHLHFVFGVMNDKDLDAMFAILPQKNTSWYFCRPDVPRGLDSQILKQYAFAKGINGESYNSVKEALLAAIAAADIDDLVFIGGSTFVVAEVI